MFIFIWIQFTFFLFVDMEYLTSQSHNGQAGGGPGMDGPHPGHAAYNVQYNRHLEDRMRRRLKFQFMNPWEKWRAKKKFPYKMILQIIKVVLVTVQVSAIMA